MSKINGVSKKAFYESKTEKLVSPIIQASDVELVDVEYVKEDGIYYLRVTIDKETGITFEDCKRVSKPLSRLLDEVDFIEESYMLEVGSPGLGRPLKKDKDFDRNIGRKIEVHTYQLVNKVKKLVGLLNSWDTNNITLTLENNESIVIQRTNIAVIKEYVEFQ